MAQLISQWWNKRTWKEQKITIVLLLGLVIGPSYFSIGFFHDPKPLPPIIELSFEDKIPVIPASIWVYLIGLYIPILLLCFHIRNKEVFFHITKLVSVVSLICLGVFLFFPIAYAQPDIDAPHTWATEGFKFWHLKQDTLSLWALDTIYTLDPAVNTFPSLHMVFTTSFALGYHLDKHKLAPLMWTNVALVFLSILTTKQHFFLDGLVAIVLVFAVHSLMTKLQKPSLTKQ